MSYRSGQETNNNNAPSVEDCEQLLAQYSDEHDNDLVRLGQRIGAEGLNAVLETFGGLKPHIPCAERFWLKLKREQRDELIKKRFKGNNIEELAIEFCLSERQVHRIVCE